MSHPTYVISLSPQAKWYQLIWFKYLIPLTCLNFLITQIPIGYSREFINSVKFYLDKMQPIICSNKSKEQLTNKDRIKEHFITDKQTKTDKL